MGPEVATATVFRDPALNLSPVGRGSWRIGYRLESEPDRFWACLESRVQSQGCGDRDLRSPLGWRIESFVSLALGRAFGPSFMSGPPTVCPGSSNGKSAGKTEPVPEEGAFEPALDKTRHAMCVETLFRVG